eukprot:jgi/Chrzof1/2124/Cz11g03140.t1
MDALRPLLSGNLLARVGLDQTRMYLASLLLGAAGKPLDVLYSRLGGFNGGFFEQGWGDLGVVNFREDLELIRRWPPGDLKVDFKLLQQGRWEGIPYKHYEGCFTTPCVERVWDTLPAESRTGRVQLLVPSSSSAQPSSSLSAAAAGSSCMAAPGLSGVIHLAATGDQGFERRLRLGWPMMRHRQWVLHLTSRWPVCLAKGVATFVLESPYYGARRPPDQKGSKLRYVSDLLALGWATIYESLHLLHWMEKEGYSSKGEPAARWL